MKSEISRQLSRRWRQTLASFAAICMIASVEAAPAAREAQAQLIPGPFEASVRQGLQDTVMGSWGMSVGAQSYRVLVRKNRTDGFEVIADNLPPTTSEVSFAAPALCDDWNYARMRVQACDGVSCRDADAPLAPIFFDYFDSTKQMLHLVLPLAPNTLLGGGGLAVSPDGLTLAVGAPGAGSPGTHAPGVVHVFTRATLQEPWRLQATVQPFGTSPYAEFGKAIALSDDYLVVGAPKWLHTFNDGQKQFSGRVEIYKREGTQWLRKTGFLDANGVTGDLYGAAVAFSADARSLAIGVPGKTVGGTVAVGRVQVWTRNGDEWVVGGVSVSTLSVPVESGLSRTAVARFGSSLAFYPDGSKLIVGAPSRPTLLDGTAVETGATYVYQWDPEVRHWNPIANLRAPTPTLNAKFGSSLALATDSKTLAVTAPFDDVSQANGAIARSAGSVYVFRRSDPAWPAISERLPSTPVEHAQFGTSVSISTANGAMLAVGAPGEVDQGVGGTAHVFIRANSAWSEQPDHWTASNPTTRFGESIVVPTDARSLIVGAPLEDRITAADAGALKVY